MNFKFAIAGLESLDILGSYNPNPVNKENVPAMESEVNELGNEVALMQLSAGFESTLLEFNILMSAGLEAEETTTATPEKKGLMTRAWEGIQKLLKALGGYFGKAIEYISNKFSKLKNFKLMIKLRMKIDAIGEFVKAIGPKLKSKTASKEEIKNAISDAIKKAKQKCSDVITKIKSMFKKASPEVIKEMEDEVNEAGDELNSSFFSASWFVVEESNDAIPEESKEIAAEIVVAMEKEDNTMYKVPYVNPDKAESLVDLDITKIMNMEDSISETNDINNVSWQLNFIARNVCLLVAGLDTNVKALMHDSIKFLREEDYIGFSRNFANFNYNKIKANEITLEEVNKEEALKYIDNALLYIKNQDIMAKTIFKKIKSTTALNFDKIDKGILDGVFEKKPEMLTGIKDTVVVVKKLMGVASSETNKYASRLNRAIKKSGLKK